MKNREEWTAAEEIYLIERASASGSTTKKGGTKKGGGLLPVVAIFVIVSVLFSAWQKEQRKAREARESEGTAQAIGTALSVLYGRGNQQPSSPSPLYREAFGDPTRPNLNQRLPGEPAESPFDSTGRVRPGYRVNYDQNGNAVGYSKESR